MTQKLRSRVKALEEKITGNPDEYVEIFGYTLPVLSEAEGQRRGLQPLTLDMVIRNDFDCDFVTPELIAVLAATVKDFEQSECDEQIVSELFQVFIAILKERGIVEAVAGGRYRYTPDYAWDRRRAAIPDHVAAAVRQASHDAWAMLQQQRPELVSGREFDNILLNTFYSMLEQSGL